MCADRELSEQDNNARQKWDRIYSKANLSAQPAPSEVLQQFAHLLPSSGSALDVACGLGGNALFLAERNFAVTAVDISAVAIKQVEQQQPDVTTRCEPVVHTLADGVGSYDVIVVSHYLDRSNCELLVNALRAEGVLFYQTFTEAKVNRDAGPSNPQYLLAANELLSLFSELKVLAFSDQGTVGDLDSGFRNQSYLVAQK